MIQNLQLGIAGSEVTLPTESRTNEQGAPTMFTVDARSSNKTLHTDFIAMKENWTIAWEKISQSNYNLIYSLILLQQTTPTFLSFKYTDEEGVYTTKTVKVVIASKGTLVQAETYFYSGFSIAIEEV